MQKITFNDTDLSGLKLINPFIADDERGYLLKSFEKGIFKKNGIDIDVFEYFESMSVKGVIRGLHFQNVFPQSKLIRVTYGCVYDVAVDLRDNSDTYGRWQGFYLSNDNKTMLFIPKGFAHGFLTLSDKAIVTYTCDGEYYPEFDDGIKWNDPDIGIDWPVDGLKNIIVSDKDKKLQNFEEYKKK